jgi:hypothetical protein
VRREIFPPLLSKLQKRGKNTKDLRKKFEKVGNSNSKK